MKEDRQGPSGAIAVVIVADDPLARAGLSAMLNDQSGLSVAGIFAAAADIGLLHDARFDLILWDQQWRSSPDAEAWDDMRSFGRPVVVLAQDDASAREAWSAGAAGVLGRDTPASTLRLALRSVARGLLALSSDFGPALRSPHLGAADALPEPLTRRELEVLRLVGEGLPNKQIAAQLSITEHTVKFHLNGVLSKLGVQSRTEAAILANRMGLLPL